MLRRFSLWFSSAIGVWQTVFTCGALVLLEYLFPSWDPHGFWLLFWLTVYSAATQNILAYSNRLDTEQGALILMELRNGMDRIATMEAAIMSDVEDIEESLEKEVQHGR